MSAPSVLLQLKRYVLWVRIARAWRWLFFGLYAAALFELVFVILDLIGRADANLSQLFIASATVGIVGVALGFGAPVDMRAVARSVDRRAGLADRLSSALSKAESAFMTEVEADARERLSGLKPSCVFRPRMGRLHVGALACAALPLALFQLNASHILLGPQDKKERAELKANAQKIERVIAHFNKPENKKELSEEEKSLQRELERLKKDIDKGHLDKLAAQEKAQKIEQLADQLMHQRVEKSQENLDSAKAALDRYKRDEARKVDSSLSGMTDQQLDDRMSELEQQSRAAPREIDRLSKEMAEIQKNLANPNLSAKERSDLEKRLTEARKQMQSLKLSLKVKQMLERMRNNPLWKEILKAMRELERNNKSMGSGKHPTLTPEELEELRQELEAMAEALKDDAAMQEYLQKLLEAIKEGKLGQCDGVCMGLGLGLGIPGYGVSDDKVPSGAPLNFNDKESLGAGKTHAIGVRGDRRGDATAPSMYLEERGPAKLSGPSSIPMLKNVPASKRKAEEAIDKQQIPKEHQERVKRYFQALEGK